MKPAARRIGYVLLAAAYVVSAFAVFRHVTRESGRVTIRISHWQLEAGCRDAFAAMIRRYEELNPRVHVVQIAVPNGPVYVSWLLTQMMGGTGPDLAEYMVIQPDVGQVFQPITSEVMEPNPYNRGTPLEGVRWRDTFIDGMSGDNGYVTALHGYYSVALGSHVNRLVYNKPLLREITGRSTPPADYRELLADCARIRAYAAERRLDLVPIANSKDTAPALSQWIAVALTSRLGERIDGRHQLSFDPDEPGQEYLRGSWSFDTPDVVAGIRCLREYGGMCTPGFWGRERNTAVTDFVSGRAVMIVSPSWQATDILSLARFEIGAFRFPYPTAKDPVYGAYSADRYSDGGFAMGTTIFLSRRTRHRAEAVDFLRFITSQEGEEIFSRHSNWPPATRGVKASPFASQLLFDPNGYCCGVDFVTPTGEPNAYGFVFSHMVDLWSPDGGVDAFRAAMKAGFADAVREDLRGADAQRLDGLRRTDAQACAQVESVAPGSRSPTLPVGDIHNEETVYQDRIIMGGGGGTTTSGGSEEVARDSLDLGWRRTAGPPGSRASAARTPSLDASPGGRSGTGEMRPRLRCAAPRQASRATIYNKDLAEAWAALGNLETDRAMLLFGQLSHSPDPAVARAGAFGEAIALLDRQPVSASQIEEVRRDLTALLSGGTDDAGLGARFFLGRIAQIHQASPDPLEAAGEYARLVADAPGSCWAETALPRLALLQIYALDGGSPAERIAEAGRLLPLATTPQARSDLHVVIARAILFHRLPFTGALAHLIEADRIALLEPGDRQQVRAQIIEMLRLAGRRPEAAERIRGFLQDYPLHPLAYHFREMLASLEK
jgi:ABC-type glycerol-3-phosphate transport system substrate-binding protein